VLTLAIGILLQTTTAWAKQHASSTAPNPNSFTNFTPTPTSSTNSSSASQTPVTAPNPDSFTSYSAWQSSDYFKGAYLPTLIAVIYGVIWKCVFTRLKEMEPIFQLAKPQGALAKDSLYLSYADTSLIKILILTFRNRHVLVLVGAVNMGIITVSTAIAPEVLHIHTTGDCGNATGDGNNCVPSLAVRGELAFFLGIVLYCISGSVVYLMISLYRRKSGIFAEATSIAGVAALTSHTALSRQTANGIDARARFSLGHQDHRDETKFYGLINDEVVFQTFNSQQHPPAKKSKKSKRPLTLHRSSLFLFWLYLIGLLILILYYRYGSRPSPGNHFENFMDSSSFGIRLLFACFGLGVRFFLTSIERYDRKMEPYRALVSLNGATAAESVLVTGHAHAFTAFLHRRTIRDPVGGMLSFTTLLAEVLIIALAAVPFSKETAWTAFDASVLLSTVIIAVMLVLVPVVMVRYWKSGDNVVNAPKCIAEVVGMLGDKEVVRKFEGLGGMKRKERDRLVESWGARFYLRRRIGQKGDGRWSIVMGE
jgi:hypothetical protein